MSSERHILVTAFEPSGDAVAAPLIAELHRRDPALVIHALGGTRMAAAGAQLIETTTQDAVIGVPPVRKVLEHRARMARLRAWMSRPPGKLEAVIPTDSPAANWAVCEATRATQPHAKIIHLVAPQLWAWGAWRIRKMRRLSDHALCLLPFEPGWFASRGVPATFVGHPIFDEPPAERAARQRAAAGDEYPDAPLKLAVLPGSRPSEWRANWATMVSAVSTLTSRHPQMRTLVAAVDDQAAGYLSAAGSAAMEMRVAQTDAVLDWADVVLAVSGTVTLQVAAHRKPMVVLYNVSRLTWHLLGRWVISTRTFTLPNLIGEHLGSAARGHWVPEFVPHFGEVAPVVAALAPLMAEGEARSRQRELFDAIHASYDGVRFEREAADVVLRLMVG